MNSKSIVIKISHVLLAVLLLFSSCMVTRTTIGDGPVGKQGKTEVYSKSKQFYLFWGFVKLGKGQPAIPEDKNLQVKTSYNAFDALLTTLTGGIFSMQTVKIIVKETP